MAPFASEQVPDAPPGERRRARLVTYTAVVVLLTAALLQLDAWPMTAYRLFSSVRTADGVSLTLWAEGVDGTRTDLRPAAGEVLGMTTHLYRQLEDADPAHARELVDAWLGLAGMRPADVSQVVLERTTWRMDAETREKHETGHAVVAVVTP
ncbi:hypothetical protein AAG589_10925 [Isoptericola sp. F-RaC21]|uniref:hypothetical protein n=1 Tax=Isoptericola sp. F-RaC21 TaxID=3141452 RepID=UPI00315BE7DB